MHQSQQFAAPRRQDPAGSGLVGSLSAINSSSYSSVPQSASVARHPAGDELHMPGLIPQQEQQHQYQQPLQQHRQHLSQHDYAPHIAVDEAPLQPASAPQSAYYQQHHQLVDSVPNILQPGLSSRPQAVSANTAPALPTLQGTEPLLQDHRQPSRDYRQAPSKPPALNMAHAYSRSSPAAGYDTPSSYNPYTPTTPGGSASGTGSSSQFMSPTEMPKYSSAGRTISNTPLGLADIRPRADSTMSEGAPGTLGYDLANTQPGTSNYMAQWPMYAFDWCKWRPQGNGAGKLAIGSYLEDGHNFIQILDSHISPTPQDVYSSGSSKYTLEFNKVAEATHSYPVTRLLWEPPSSQKQSTDLLATSGDHLRLWSLPSETPATPGSNINRRGVDATTKLTPLALLSNSKTPDHTAPLTSLDWNTVSPSLIITSSIDTTCTIWDIPSLTAKTQLIAHDKEVYDVRFCANSVDVFVSCGQDGSVRMFDLRSLEHSTIIYEPTGKEERDGGSGRSSPTAAQQSAANPPPLLRLATSPHDTHLLATFAQDSGTIRILDVRQPGQALLELRGHSGSINCLEWSPLRRGMLASGGDDCQVLLWDLLNSGTSATSPLAGQQDAGRNPVATWECDYEITNLGWVPQLQGDYGEWLGITAGRGIWGTRVA